MTCSFSKEFSASAFTSVENVFIYEYLPVSSGETVKVYLYGLFLCQHNEYDVSISKMAEILRMSESDVIKCFEYWEEFGILSIVSKDPFQVQYLPIRSSTSSKPRKYKAEKYTDFAKSLQLILPNRMISIAEYGEYFSTMETYQIKPEAMLMIVKYCADMKGSDIGYKYVLKVAKDFGSRGITTEERVDNELSSYVLRTAELEKILQALQIKRKPEIDDLNLYKKWTRELNFEPANILYTAKALKRGSMNKLDEFLLELFSMKRFSETEIADYVKHKKKVYELAIKINKALSVYVDVIDTVVDNYTKKWITYGFEENTLLYIANVCFKTGRNTLQYMDELVEKLYKSGYVNLTSVGDYFENVKKTDQFISKMLLTAGINRRPTPWDREQIEIWKGWNFTEEMILEAAKLAAGKSSAIPYMNSVLSNWKNKGNLTVESVNSDLSESDSQEAYNREYEKRRNIALTRAQKNLEKALSIDGFTEIYSRLNSIEKDLAFAEINNNQTALKELENEQKIIKLRGEELLSKNKLTFEDLSPKYKCEKCNDTGYVGTHRCDCYKK